MRPSATAPAMRRVIDHLPPDIREAASERLLPDLDRAVVDRALFRAFVAATAELLGPFREELIAELRRLLAGSADDRAHAIYELTLIGAVEARADIATAADDRRAGRFAGRRETEPADGQDLEAIGAFQALMKAARAKTPGERDGDARRAEIGVLCAWSLGRLDLL